MIIQEQTQLMHENSNTTLVKVKYIYFDTMRFFLSNSNTTLVKVKLGEYTI